MSLIVLIMANVKCWLYCISVTALILVAHAQDKELPEPEANVEETHKGVDLESQSHGDDVEKTEGNPDIPLEIQDSSKFDTAAETKDYLLEQNQDSPLEKVQEEFPIKTQEDTFTKAQENLSENQKSVEENPEELPIMLQEDLSTKAQESLDEDQKAVQENLKGSSKEVQAVFHKNESEISENEEELPKKDQNDLSETQNGLSSGFKVQQHHEKPPIEEGLKSSLMSQGDLTLNVSI